MYQPKNKKGGGRLIVLGSTKMFEDEYIEKEENFKLFEILISLLLFEDNIEINN